jgi:hypothetical protein
VIKATAGNRRGACVSYARTGRELGEWECINRAADPVLTHRIGLRALIPNLSIGRGYAVTIAQSNPLHATRNAVPSVTERMYC